MTILRCPKYISEAVDEFGEVFKCPKCGHFIRYAPNG